MQSYHTYRQFGQTVLAWILAFLVLCAGAAGTGTAFADDAAPDSSAAGSAGRFDRRDLDPGQSRLIRDQRGGIS